MISEEDTSKTAHPVQSHPSAGVKAQSIKAHSTRPPSLSTKTQAILTTSLRSMITHSPSPILCQMLPGKSFSSKS